LHLVSGALLELSARHVLPISFLDANSSLIFGLVAGGSLLIAALPVWYPAPTAEPAPAPATS
ncbi:MAG TPA: hypothetical protein VKY74_15095, partial [Chloroflexia bacterium]|nr:hypothetical protein [Chloroflexia bacterium]